MPELLNNSVEKKTLLHPGYCAYSSSQSMEAYLKDWKRAHARLGRRISKLEALIEERKQQEENGTWEQAIELYEKNLEAAKHGQGGV